MQNKNNRNGSNHQVESMLFRPRTIKKLNEKKGRKKKHTHTHQRKTTTTSKMKNIVTAATQQPNNVQHR